MAPIRRRSSQAPRRLVGPALEIDHRSPYDPSIAQSMARLVRFLADELDHTNGALPSIVAQEMAQGVLVAYLLANRSNYSHRLHGVGAAVARCQVRLTVDFLEEHWQEPVTNELLATVAGTSARNLFHTFGRASGMSPMRYVRRLRLGHGRELLSAAGPNSIIASVG